MAMLICSSAYAAVASSSRKVEALQHSLHLNRRPYSVAPRRWNALFVQAFCDGPQTRFPGFRPA